MPFYIDDIPAEPFVIEPPETIDLTLFTAATAEIVAPDAVTMALVASIDEITMTITVDQPAVSAFLVEGVHRLRIVVESADARRALPDVRLVVQDADSEWHTLDSIREEWADAEVIPDPSLWELLELARGQVLEFAPAVVDADGNALPVPSRYRDGQRIHARNIWNASKVSPDGGLGGDDFVIRPFPLDWHVKQILRPKHGIPVVA